MSKKYKDAINAKDLDVFDEAYDESFMYHNENVLMLESYVENIIKDIENSMIGDLLSLGIGHRVVSSSIINKIGKLKKYEIIEGSQSVIKRFNSNRDKSINIDIHCEFFEDFQPKKLYDGIEMGFVLEHVKEPGQILKHYISLLRPGGYLYIAVPNAKSLHRLIGHSAGFLNDYYQLSEYDLSLGHQHYFDLNSLRLLINQFDVDILEEKGLYLKPFTNKQMKMMQLSDNVYKSLNIVANDYPDISNGIFIKAQKRA